MSNIEIYNKLTGLLKAKASEILPKGSRLALYGSRARGDEREDSDWDIHILIPGEEQLPLSKWDEYAWPFELIGLQSGELVNARIYSIPGWLKRKFLPFYTNVEQDKIILYQS